MPTADIKPSIYNTVNFQNLQPECNSGEDVRELFIFYNGDPLEECTPLVSGVCPEVRASRPGGSNHKVHVGYELSSTICLPIANYICLVYRDEDLLFLR